MFLFFLEEDFHIDVDVTCEQASRTCMQGHVAFVLKPIEMAEAQRTQWRTSKWCKNLIHDRTTEKFSKWCCGKCGKDRNWQSTTGFQEVKKSTRKGPEWQSASGKNIGDLNGREKRERRNEEKKLTMSLFDNQLSSECMKQIGCKKKCGKVCKSGKRLKDVPSRRKRGLSSSRR